VELGAGFRHAAILLAVYGLPIVRAASSLPGNAPAEAPKEVRVERQFQHFVCNTGYSLPKCQVDMAVLKRILAKYPTSDLGEWTWVLVRSADWKYNVMRRGMDPDSPAFTYLPKRETFIEEALVATVPQRAAELILRWQMRTDDLLDLAVSHELAHVLCNEPSEARANGEAVLLRQGKPLACREYRSRKTKTEEGR
jgi:hypothetical protein